MAYTFYNPKKCALSISISYERKCGILEFARSLNPNHRGPIPKGTKLFDWENKLVFTISPEEAPKILKFLKGHIKEDAIHLRHAPTGNTREKLSVLTLGGKYPYINITCSITHNNNKNSATYTLRSNDDIDEISVFYKFIEEIPLSIFKEDYLRFAYNFANKRSQ